MELTLAFSPCPNDTFIFDALVNGKIDTDGISFKVSIEDVETLNKQALKAKHDITKLSFFAYANTWKNYQILPSGGAAGYGCGPLLVSTSGLNGGDIQENAIIAIPGKFTTANLLLSIAFPWLTKKKEYVFNEIENAVLSGKADAGVIIHESRFTYQKHRLKKSADLGELWEKKTGLPIPLGAIAIKRNLPEKFKKRIGTLIRKSVEFAMEHPDASSEFVKQHASEMDKEVRNKHIALYVNEFTRDIGKTGKESIMLLMKNAYKNKLIKKIPENIFLTYNNRYLYCAWDKL